MATNEDKIMNFDAIDLNILLHMFRFENENGDDIFTIYEIARETLGITKKAQSKIDYRLQRLSEANIIIMRQDSISRKRYFRINKENVFYYDNYKMDLGFKEVDYGKTIVFDIDGDIVICHLEKNM